MKIAVIGAGAAGCFCAIELKRRLPSAQVEVFESKRKALAKVAVTGGGRCNLTNSFSEITKLSQAYPRGDKLMKKVFRTFDHRMTWEWFENEGVALTLQEDQCVFPVSQDAMEIVNLLLKRMRQLGVILHTGHKVTGIYSKTSGGYGIAFDGPPEHSADKVVVTTGGSPGPAGFGMLDSLNLEIVPPVPSLFSFNLEDKSVRSLMGTVVEDVTASIAGTPFKASGPLLVTHWGMSGPAVLKLSSYAARHLAGKGYEAVLSVNWLGTVSEQTVRETVGALAKTYPQKLVMNSHPETIPSRLWQHIVKKSGIREDARWAETGSKGMNRLVNTLMNDSYSVKGKSRFTEEFVTCGGVALSNISPGTLECKQHPGLYFAGEVLDIDAITGGFNLQAAWSAGYLVAVSLAASYGECGREGQETALK